LLLLTGQHIPCDTNDVKQIIALGYYPIVAKAGGIQIHGVKGKTVVGYRKSLTKRGLKIPLLSGKLNYAGFPEGETTWQNRLHSWNSPLVKSRKIVFTAISVVITVH